MSDAALYRQALEEYRSGQADEALKAKAYVLAGSGDDRATEIAYVKLRVSELKKSNAINTSQRAVTATVSAISPHVAPMLRFTVSAIKAVLLFTGILMIGWALVVLLVYADTATTEGRLVMLMGLVGGITLFLIGRAIRLYHPPSGRSP